MDVGRTFSDNTEMKYCENNYDWLVDLLMRRSIMRIILTCELLVWVIGILGNLLSVVIFRDKNLARQPINLIFWWLSISDLLELFVLALNQWYQGRLGEIYLLNVVHAITIGLNIVLVFCQYKVVAHPLTNQTNPFKNRSVKLAVIWVYVLSFVSYLPFWCVHAIEGPFYMDTTNFSSPYCTVAYGGVSTETEAYTNIISSNPLFTAMSLLFCGVVLRIGLLITLIIMCVMLLFAINKAHRDRQNLGLPPSQLSKAQRKVNRMNATIVVITIMFLVTEIPLALSSFLYLVSVDFYYCFSIINEYILLPFILLNCCYNTFCYFIRIKEYRKILKSLLSKSNWFSSRARVVEQTDVELQPIRQ